MKFLKLSGMIINVSHIVKIVKYEKKFEIYTLGDSFGFGSSFYGSCIYINKNDAAEDYNKICEFIDKN